MEQSSEPTLVAPERVVTGADATVAADGEATPAAWETNAPLERGTQLGRYVVLDRLGAGGMGVVYAAYDPDLDRKVALKLLHSDLHGSTGGSHGESRLLREAQAMARLSHPNVIAVHDVGTVGEQVFVAMEFVEGGTLGAWQKKRTWREILATYIQAARGLVAAHAAGIVHRDFKPDNVLVGRDGRARVLDFGLARRAGSEARQAWADKPVEHATSSQLDVDLTRTGAVLGTPAYMAPEQHLGREPGEASDQFSFCVALYEALYGQRPFVGDNAANLALKVLEGKIREPPRDSAVPGWIWRLLRQGLATDPESRHASMTALVDALGRDPAVRRRRVLAGMAGVAVVAGAVWGTARATAAPAVCTGAKDQIAAVWNDERRAAVRSAFTASGAVYAEDAVAAVGVVLDRQAAQWEGMHTEACEATRVRGEQSEQLMDLRMACLAERRVELATTIEVLAAADEKTVRKAANVVDGLTPLAVCADVKGLSARVAPPTDPALAARVEQIRAQVLRASAEYRSGHAKLAREAIGVAVTAAREVDYPPLLASALGVQGFVLGQSGKMKEAEAALEEAIWTGIRAGDDITVAKSATELTYFLGYEGARHAEGERWYQLAKAMLDRTDAAPATAVRLHYARGATAFGAGDLDGALAAFEQSRDLAAEKLPPEHRYHGLASTAVGNIHFVQNRTDEALEHYLASLKLWQSTLGEFHPHLADVYSNIGNVHWKRDEFEESRHWQRKALAVYEKVYGPEHPDAAAAIAAIAVSYEDESRFEEAIEHHERALAIWEKTVGPDHPDLALSIGGLGNIALRQEDAEAAERHHRRALELREKALGPDHPETAASVTSVADALMLGGRPAEAAPLYERAWKAKAEALGPTHDSSMFSRSRLGEALCKSGNPREGFPHLEAALATLQESEDRGPTSLGGAQFRLAKALWDHKRARPRALELARAAVDGVSKQQRPEVEAWIAERA